MSTNKRFSEKFNSYLDGELLQEAKEWFESNKKKLEDLYKNPKLIHYIFEPFISIIDFKQSLLPRDIYKIITLVAVINSVLAGLPGKMGVGVFVSIGLEIWMAIKIAQFLNLTNLQTSEDILKFFKNSTWNVVGLEMEGAHYQKAIQSASKIRRSISSKVKVQYAYYASDNPLETGGTLASGGLGTSGVKPTYLITEKMLNQILV